MRRNFRTVYRGLEWVYEDLDLVTYAAPSDGAYMLLPSKITIKRWVCVTVKDSDLFLLWPEAMAVVVQRPLLGLREAASMDGIPWLIHRIEDEDAYERALTAYKLNIVNPG